METASSTRFAAVGTAVPLVAGRRNTAARRRWIVVVQGALCLVFLVAAFGAMAESSRAVEGTLIAIGWLPLTWNEPVARAMPVIELALGLWLLTGLYARAAARFAILLLVVFSAAIVSLGSVTNWSADCGCFPIFQPTSLYAALARNIVMIAAALVLLRLLRSVAAPATPTSAP